MDFIIDFVANEGLVNDIIVFWRREGAAALKA